MSETHVRSCPRVARIADTKVTALSTESIASSTQTTAGVAAQCASCGMPLAADQRYCLECGERRAPLSSGVPAVAPSGDTPTQSTSPPMQPPHMPAAAGTAGRGSTTTVIAGVGVLLLAMGVGILIGRSGNAKQAAAPAPEVVTVAGTGSSATSTGASEPSFTSNWPSGTSGYTVELETLPQSSATVSTVEAAKTAATGKGAKAVGALKSEEFSSLASGSYVIYSGVYREKAEATKALAGLLKSFPNAKVISVSNQTSEGSNPSTTSPGGVGQSESKPAPPSVLKGLEKAKGKNYEEKSKSLPDVVSTG
jgi:hypothetical protein